MKPEVQVYFEATPADAFQEPRWVIARLFRRYRKNPKVSICRIGPHTYRAMYLGCARGVIYQAEQEA